MTLRSHHFNFKSRQRKRRQYSGYEMINLGYQIFVLQNFQQIYSLVLSLFVHVICRRQKPRNKLIKVLFTIAFQNAFVYSIAFCLFSFTFSHTAGLYKLVCQKWFIYWLDNYNENIEHAKYVGKKFLSKLKIHHLIQFRQIS